MDSNKTIGYRIVLCRERSAEVRINLGNTVSESAVRFKFGCYFHTIPAGRLSITIISELMVMEQTVVKVESETVFELSPFDGAFDISNTGKIVDKIGIMPTLFSLAYGSTRGMMAIRTAGTALANFPLPIVDAMEVTAKMQQNNV